MPRLWMRRSSVDEKIRTVTVPGQTLEREERLRSNHASIRERNCRRQIDKIGGDRVMSHLSSFYGTPNINNDNFEFPPRGEVCKTTPPAAPDTMVPGGKGLYRARGMGPAFPADDINAMESNARTLIT